MDFSKLLHGIVKIDTWIFLSGNMDLSNLFYVILPFAKQNQTEVRPRFQAC